MMGYASPHPTPFHPPCPNPTQIAHTDISLDDVWSLDLSKLDGWRSCRENSAGEEAFRDLELSEDDEEGEDGSD